VRMSEKRKRNDEEYDEVDRARAAKKLMKRAMGKRTRFALDGPSGSKMSRDPAVQRLRDSQYVSMEDVELLEDLVRDREAPIEALLEAEGWTFEEAPPKPPRMRRQNASVALPVETPVMQSFTERNLPKFGTEFVNRGVPDFVPSRDFGRIELKDSKALCTYSTWANFLLGQTVSTNLLGANLFGIAQGASKNQRVGTRMVARSINVKWRWDRTPSGPTSSSASTNAAKSLYCRFVVVLDRQPNSSTPATWATVFDDTGVSTDPILQFPLSENARRFNILCDRITVVGDNNVTSYLDAAAVVKANVSGASEYEKFYKVFENGLVVTFSGTGGTYDAISTNGLLFLAAVGPNVASGNPPANSPAVTVLAQVRYTDF